MSSPAEAAMPPAIGPFRILRTLGTGAMGVVYLGERAEQFQQRVAIKMLHPHVSLLMGDAALRHEEKVLTSLDHAAIVRLLDTGEHAHGMHYIVMEYVDGVPVDVYCREGALTREQRLALLLEIARAVDYAHRRLVIHADLKPENILVTQEGQPRILDFGVALLANAAGGDAAAASYTPAYASTEQRAQQRVTAATDVYSLGVLVRNILTHEGIHSIRLSDDLKAILAKATRDEPELRYASMNEFAAEMQAVLEHRPVAARNGNGLYRFGKWMRYRRATAALVLTLAAVLLASVTGVVIQTVRAARQRRVTQARLYDLVRLTGTLEGELYNSAHSLAHGEDASASLLQAATASLDKLAAENGGDTALALEMARQYGALARLQRVQGASPRAAQHDVERELTLLRSIPAGDRNHAAAQQQMSALNAR